MHTRLLSVCDAAVGPLPALLSHLPLLTSSHLAPWAVLFVFTVCGTHSYLHVPTHPSPSILKSSFSPTSLLSLLPTLLALSHHYLYDLMLILCATPSSEGLFLAPLSPARLSYCSAMELPSHSAFHHKLLWTLFYSFWLLITDPEPDMMQTLQTFFFNEQCSLNINLDYPILKQSFICYKVL